MEAEEVLKLFDSCWFERGIFTRKHDSPAPPTTFVHQRMDQSSEESSIFGAQNLRRRSLSDPYVGVDISSYLKDEPAAGKAASPKSVIIKPKLQKIFSGKEIAEFCTEVAGQEKAEKPSDEKKLSKKKKGIKKGMITKSLSALEFEEVKGFTDLGFVFSEEDKNSNLISIIPGLQKWGERSNTDYKDNGELQIDEKCRVSRPYLSEAWGVSNKGRGNKSPLMNWSIPSVKNEINMKDRLRVWAHTVASTVK